MTSPKANCLIASCIIFYTSATIIQTINMTTENYLSTLSVTNSTIKCDYYQFCCLQKNNSLCNKDDCNNYSCTATSSTKATITLTSLPLTTNSSFEDYSTQSTINSTDSTLNITTPKFIPKEKDSRTSLKIFLIFVAIVVVIAVVVIIIGRRHCCNAVKTNITAKFTVKKDSELEYIIDDGEFMNPDDPPVLAEMKVTPNSKRSKTKKEESLHSLSGKNKDGSLQLYGATTSAALPC